MSAFVTLGWLSLWEYSTNVTLNKWLFIDDNVEANNSHNYKSNNFPQNKGNNLGMGHDEVQTKRIGYLVGDTDIKLRSKMFESFTCFGTQFLFMIINRFDQANLKEPVFMIILRPSHQQPRSIRFFHYWNLPLHEPLERQLHSLLAEH